MAKFDVGLTIPDEIVQEVLNDFTEFHGYQEQIFDEKTGKMIANSQTRAQFMKQAIIRFIKDSVKTHRARKAVEQATDIDKAEIT